MSLGAVPIPQTLFWALSEPFQSGNVCPSIPGNAPCISSSIIFSSLFSVFSLKNSHYSMIYLLDRFSTCKKYFFSSVLLLFTFVFVLPCFLPSTLFFRLFYWFVISAVIKKKKLMCYFIDDIENVKAVIWAVALK